jgi:hypothetical protein
MGAAAVAWAADPDDDDTDKAPPPKQSKVWVNSIFTRNQPPPAPKPDTTKTKTPAPKPAPKVDPAQSKRTKELRDYLRRMAVCDQLSQIALETRDQELMKQVEQLKERVWLTYKLRTVGPMTHPETDDQMLDRQLGQQAAAGGKAYEPLLSTSRAKDQSSLTASKEDYRP